MAHPVRLELLELLATQGAQTATEAAATLEQTPANVSWHLRKLGEHGFVEQDRSGPGRRRPWRMVAQDHTWGDDAEDPRAAAALLGMVMEREIDVMRAAMERHDQEPEDWRTATNFITDRLWLTPEEARALSAQVSEPARQYAHRSEQPAARPPGSRLMALTSWVVPYPPTQGKTS
jgi:DNA-binding transcriptional ArsR family regulator